MRYSFYIIVTFQIVHNTMYSIWIDLVKRRKLFSSFDLKSPRWGRSSFQLELTNSKGRWGKNIYRKYLILRFKWMINDVKMVISREITPLEALYPPPIKNVLKRAATLSFTLDLRSQWSQGRYAHAYGICDPFYGIILKK